MRYVGDGDSDSPLGNTTDPATWIEVRLSDFDVELQSAAGRADRERLIRVVGPTGSIVSRFGAGPAGLSFMTGSSLHAG